MKIIAQVFLYLFLAFLTTPAIITAIEKSSDTSMFFSCSEEEHSKEIKELKQAVYPQAFEHEFITPFHVDSKLILSANTVKLDNISVSIFAPPPNCV